jgi:hypothetical protein
MIIRGAGTKRESPAEISVGVKHVGGNNRLQLVAVCVNDSHLPQTAKVVLNFGLASGNPSLVEGIDFPLVIQIEGVDVERGGLERIRHTFSIVDPLEVKVKGSSTVTKIVATCLGREALYMQQVLVESA